MLARASAVTAFLLVPGLAAAQGSFDALGQSVAHSGEAIGYSVAAGAQAVSAVAAVPLGVSGQVGHVSGEMSDELWEAANAPIGEPLPIADDVVTAGPPPGEALRAPVGDQAGGDR